MCHLSDMKKIINKSSKAEPAKGIGYLLLEEESWGKVGESLGEYGMAYGKVQPLFQFLNLSQEESARVAGVSSRTLARWGSREPIGLTASERIAKIDYLIKTGVEVFKNETAFKNWFAEKNFSLGGKSPKEIIGRPFGIDLLHDTLLALQFGNVM